MRIGTSIMLPNPEDIAIMRQHLNALRIYLASLNSPELADLEALLSVADAELERAIRQAPGHLRYAAGSGGGPNAL